VFVFALIFSYLEVAARDQYKILFWGVIYVRERSPRFGY
jgi:predicted tellurium resistance membrane protein TerC